MSQLEQILLSNSSGIKTQFQIESEKIEDLINQLKQINDQLQATQITEQQNSQLMPAKQNFKMKAENIKQIVTSLEKSIRGNEQKNILSKLKQSFQKEVERQRRILKSSINSSYEKRFSRISIIRQSRIKGSEIQAEQLKYFVEHNYVKIGQKDERIEQENKRHSSVKIEDNSKIKTISIDEEFRDQEWIDLENILIEERQKELDDIEREAVQLNLLANQMGSTLGQQGVNLNFGQQNISQVKPKVIQTQNKIVSVDRQQKSRFKKKYYIIIGILILIIVVMIILLISIY
ncbi:unnamed protein product (macronuclear) [Paramecium tetraurelia]|uniref:Chromosome undetermined scaffold_13, whole genome shotgun sequence n=1 Tax=Paramecium tetraurelia TaxID=5888 RepID=Q3M0Z7_PARTE|nr:uncharacterized protein GSPATT00005608001 [Paramecium tetraurelia]CAH69625.1 syntaxin 7-2 [Paramecium tetraurelia]CAK62362.1 unnamed protein product [Paramecium tetraurelia]|eukprot:XP_001429760.1 hypothetical protein (macronuclear) [Paramecium tetraurelia strain d4-2]